MKIFGASPTYVSRKNHAIASTSRACEFGISAHIHVIALKSSVSASHALSGVFAAKTNPSVVAAKPSNRFVKCATEFPQHHVTTYATSGTTSLRHAPLTAPRARSADASARVAVVAFAAAEPKSKSASTVSTVSTADPSTAARDASPTSPVPPDLTARVAMPRVARASSSARRVDARAAPRPIPAPSRAVVHVVAIVAIAAIASIVRAVSRRRVVRRGVAVVRASRRRRGESPSSSSAASASASSRRVAASSRATRVAARAIGARVAATRVAMRRATARVKD
jgi:hypothetical protein